MIIPEIPKVIVIENVVFQVEGWEMEVSHSHFEPKVRIKLDVSAPLKAIDDMLAETKVPTSKPREFAVALRDDVRRRFKL